MRKNPGGGTEKSENPYYSGEGSHKDEFIEPYCRMIREFIKKNNVSHVVDLGCGDFNVASRWINEEIVYEGIDIVREMIDHHNVQYGNDRVHFHCLDIVEDELPDGELCLIRQVLQHLSNEEVMAVLNKVRKYRFVIITEHVVSKPYAAKYNMNKSHGSGIRVREQSGLYFDEKPFNEKVETILEIPYGKENQVLTSVLIRNESLLR